MHDEENAEEGTGELALVYASDWSQIPLVNDQLQRGVTLSASAYKKGSGITLEGDEGNKCDQTQRG
eukprot:5598759-Karenia_brevis.AAC.1